MRRKEKGADQQGAREKVGKEKRGEEGKASHDARNNIQNNEKK